MKIKVQLELELDVDASITPSALVQKVIEAAGLVPASSDTFLLVQGDQYIMSPQIEEKPPVGEWLARGEPKPPEGLTVRLHRAETCMHGSPSVPGGGFLCGWC
jgi:hypothetical protein